MFYSLIMIEKKQEVSCSWFKGSVNVYDTLRLDGMGNTSPGDEVEETVAGSPELVVALGSIHTMGTDVAPGGPLRMISRGQLVTTGGVCCTPTGKRKIVSL